MDCIKCKKPIVIRYVADFTEDWRQEYCSFECYHEHTYPTRERVLRFVNDELDRVTLYRLWHVLRHKNGREWFAHIIDSAVGGNER